MIGCFHNKLHSPGGYVVTSNLCRWRAGKKKKRNWWKSKPLFLWMRSSHPCLCPSMEPGTQKQAFVIPHRQCPSLAPGQGLRCSEPPEPIRHSSKKWTVFPPYHQTAVNDDISNWQESLFASVSLGWIFCHLWWKELSLIKCSLNICWTNDWTFFF